MSLRGLVANVRDLVEAPLTQPLDMVHLFAIVGIVIISWGFWLMVLAHINRVVAEE